MTAAEIRARIYNLELEILKYDDLISTATSKEQVFELMMEREDLYYELEWLDDELQIAQGLI
jgi:hypothetical protein